LHSVHGLDYIKTPDYAIAAAHRKHIARIVEVYCEDCSAKICDCGAWLEVVSAVENLCFI